MSTILRSLRLSWALRFACVALLTGGAAVAAGIGVLQHGGSTRQVGLLIGLSALAMLCAVFALLRAGGELDVLEKDAAAREPAFMALAMGGVVFVCLTVFLWRLVAVVRVSALP